MIRKIKFTSIPVRDQDRALEFYVGTLGFTLLTDQPMGPGQRWIELRPPRGESGVALFTPPGQEDRIGTFTGISMECDDVQKTYEELSARGAVFAKPPKSEPWGVMAILQDSEGNQLVLSSAR
jgi:predicted enzyme related to lactoylglutathione lyase